MTTEKDTEDETVARRATFWVLKSDTEKLEDEMFLWSVGITPVASSHHGKEEDESE